MILDSLLPLRLLDLSNKSIIDVGTGAGYPGLPLAICSTGKFTLLDSTKKKIDHINEFVTNNKINNVRTVCCRAEDYARRHRNQYDIAIARAVASLNILLEIIVPIIKVDEINNAKRAIKELGVEVVQIQEEELPESGEKRINILFQKKKETKSKYPREYKDILDKPL